MKKFAIIAAVATGLAIGLALPDDAPKTKAVETVDFPHPLNDAWLGLTVVTTDGEKIGYVVDAPFDETGRVDFVLIDGFSEGQVETEDFIVVDGAFAERRGNHLFVDPSAPGLAAAAALTIETPVRG